MHEIDKYVYCSKCGKKVRNDSKAFELGEVRSGLLGGRISIVLCKKDMKDFLERTGIWLKEE